MNAHERNIIRRDRALPGLSLLFDVAELSGVISRIRPDLNLDGLRPSYVRYKPGMNCLVAYEIGDHVCFYAKAHNLQDGVKMQKASARPEPDHEGRPTRLPLRDHSVVVSLFPTDTKLPSLSRAQSEKPRRRIARLIGAGEGELQLHPLRYKPERRFVGVAMVEGQPRASAKFYTSRGMSRSHVRAQAASRLADVRVPRELATNRRLGCILYEWHNGVSLSQLASTPTLDFGAVASAGHALATLHAQRDDTLPNPSGTDLTSAFASTRRALSFLLPEEERLIDVLYAESEAASHRWLEDDGWVHGDFHPDQILIDDEGPAILDFDRSFSGSGIVDVGTFAAHLEFLVAANRLGRPRADAVLGALMSGYQQAWGDAPTNVESVTAACLFQLAVLPFRVRLPDWPERTRALLDRCRLLYQHNPPTFRTGRRAKTEKSNRHYSAINRHEHASVQARSSTAIHVAPWSTPFLDRALDVDYMSNEFESLKTDSGTSRLPTGLRSAHLLKHRPGRRFVVEYRPLQQDQPSLIGKVRIRNLDRRTFEVAGRLRRAGFVQGGSRGCAVPEPLGCIPAMQMCIYAKAEGVPASAMAESNRASDVFRRVGNSLAALHSISGITERQHTLEHEWDILQTRLDELIRLRPGNDARIEQVRSQCHDLILRHGTSNRDTTLHRDFYPDNVIVSEEGEVCFIDLDLCAVGHPAIDAGNFVAHLIELAARRYHDQRALDGLAESFCQGYLEADGAASINEIFDFATLSLARHLFLCCAIPKRNHMLPVLLDICEDRLTQHTASKRTISLAAMR